MKHLLKLTFLLMAILLPATAIAHDFEVDGIYYNINANEATVTYRGNSYYSYNEYSGDVTIPVSVIYNGMTYPVTSIGGYAFAGCGGLTSITIPSSVTCIGDVAFFDCTGLASITIPSSVTSIGDWALGGCSGLASITVNSNNTVFDSRSNCNAIIRKSNNELIVGCKNTVIPSSVTSIGNYAFYACSGLTAITICDDVTSIGNLAFVDCSGLTSMTIGNSVLTIGESAFNGCSGLISVTIPNSVKTIGFEAFRDCRGLTNVTIGNSVTEIGFSAFSGCTALETLNFNAESCADFHIADMMEDLGLVFYGTNISTINIGDGVKRIPAHFADGYNRLTSITIPNSVTEIGPSAFSHCSGLTSVTIGNSVTTISLDAFNSCTSLTSIDIPNSVTSIEWWAFYNCSGLTSITIGNSVASIGNYAFGGCSGLTSIIVESGNPKYDSRENCNAIVETATNTLLTGCMNTSIPNSVTKIGSYAFDGCSGLTSLTIPNSVTSVDERAFCNCKGLTSVTIPNSVTTIGENTFSGCTSLTSVNIPNSVTSIGSYAFSGCSSLDEVYSMITDLSNVIMGNNVFSRNPKNYEQRTLYVPYGTTAAYQADRKWSQYFGAFGVSDYDNYWSVGDTACYQGDTIVIPIAMTNRESIISFQTDIFLPDGLEMLQEEGEYLVEPSDRMTRNHSIISSDISSGAIRVMCYSSNYKPFEGNSGDDLFYITVKVADNANGDYTIWLKNTLLTTSDFVELTAPDAAANVHAKAYLLGDANNSGTVTVTDVVVTSQYVLEMNPQPFIFEAADVNTDGNITVTDVSRIAWMVLNPTLNAPLRAPALWNNGDRMSAESITLATGETRRVSIALDNALDYSAFQFDLSLPEGLTASNFQLTDRASNHDFDVNTLQNGNIRALCYSPALIGINGHEGALLTFDVTATGAVTGDILVDGIELVTTTCQTVKLEAFNIAVNAPSSVNEVANGKTIASVNYFNLAGQQLSEPRTGVNLVVTTYTDGTRTITKLIQK